MSWWISAMVQEINRLPMAQALQDVPVSSTTHQEDPMTEQTPHDMLRRCQAIDRMGAAYLAAHPESPRYCYTCQCWLTDATETAGHETHSVH
jgi:hypothetical protein